MSMNTVLREKRKELGMTQEQIANCLGVTTPAVNKWERGTTYPDITLLPALARLLKTDLNTLLCFHENLSEQEVGRFLKEVVDVVRSDGYDAGFRMAIGKTREYPNCMALLHSTAMALEGSLLLCGMQEDEKDSYRTQIMALFERVATCGEGKVSDSAKYMLASRLIADGQYTRAQEMLDLLPEWSGLDKRGMQADLLAKSGKTAEAAALLEKKLLMSVQDDLPTLVRLARLAMEEKDEENAIRLSKCAREECEAFGLWEYSAHVAPWEVAVARKDVPESVSELRAMLMAIEKPWDMRRSPICRHIVKKADAFAKKADPEYLAALMLPPLLQELEHNPDYDFLRSDQEFQRFLTEYRDKCAALEAQKPSSNGRCT